METGSMSDEQKTPINFEKALKRRKSRKAAVNFLEQYELKLSIDRFLNDLIGHLGDDVDLLSDEYSRHEIRRIRVTCAVIQSLCLLMADREELMKRVASVADGYANWFNETILVEGTKVPLREIAETLKREQTP
jgi:hypothetical protein